MADFINTIDALGDDVVIDSLILRTITEFKDNMLTMLGAGAFVNCQKLETVDLPSVTSANQDIFGNCHALTSVNLPELQNVSSAMFYVCRSLPSIVLPKATVLRSNCFSYCASLTTVDLSAGVTIHTNAFAPCIAITRLILRNAETVASLVNTNAFNGSPIASGTGYIYVPSALLDSYKAATNWSTYAAQFRALEDYTVDGTTTGALDETKI